MTRNELNELKQKALQRKDRSADLETMLSNLRPILATLKSFLPAEVLAVLDKYTETE